MPYCVRRHGPRATRGPSTTTTLLQDNDCLIFKAHNSLCSFAHSAPFHICRKRQPCAYCAVHAGASIILTIRCFVALPLHATSHIMLHPHWAPHPVSASTCLRCTSSIASGTSDSSSRLMRSKNSAAVILREASCMRTARTSNSTGMNKHKRSTTVLQG